MSKYPPIQWSKMLDKDRGEQFVLRAETVDELMKLKKELNERILEPLKDKPVAKQEDFRDDPNLAANYTCNSCGGKAISKEGITKGKKWNGIFCEDKKGCGAVRWA